jgi:hypothetical protein
MRRAPDDGSQDGYPAVRPAGDDRHPPVYREKGDPMRALLITVGIVAVVLILLGLFLKAVKWLIILGLIALIAAIVMGVIEARRVGRRL